MTCAENRNAGRDHGGNGGHRRVPMTAAEDRARRRAKALCSASACSSKDGYLIRTNPRSLFSQADPRKYFNAVCALLHVLGGRQGGCIGQLLICQSCRATGHNGFSAIVAEFSLANLDVSKHCTHSRRSKAEHPSALTKLQNSRHHEGDQHYNSSLQNLD